MRGVLEDHADRAVRLKRELSGEELVQDHSDRIEVSACVERISPSLLGRHVLGRSDDEAVTGELRRRRRSPRESVALRFRASDRDE